MSKNHNEAIAGVNAFQAFAKEFGPDDVYNKIILEILLEELLRPSYYTGEAKTNETPASRQTLPDK